MPHAPSPDTATTMTIGTAAAASGVSAKMIRYYEAIGLFAPSPRSASGYRHFAASDVHRLRFIRRARALGFPVADVARLLALWQDRSRASAEVKRLALAHVATLERKIAELTAMKTSLATLAAQCHGDARPECPILEDLAEPVARDAGRSARTARHRTRTPGRRAAP
jgi:MerR family transcriptional regulator, copper efflux regulator